MKISRIALTLMFSGVVFACGNAKQDAAQKLYTLTTTGTALQAALVGVQATGTPARASTGAATITGNCAGGGTAVIMVSGTATQTGTNSGSGTFNVTTTMTNCTLADGTVYDTSGAPLTFSFSASVSGSNTGGTVSASFDSTYSYNGALKITGGKAAGSYSFSTTAVTVKGNVSATQAGGTTTSASANITVVVNGSATINGSANTFSNETFTVSGTY